MPVRPRNPYIQPLNPRSARNNDIFPPCRYALWHLENRRVKCFACHFGDGRIVWACDDGLFGKTYRAEGLAEGEEREERGLHVGAGTFRECSGDFVWFMSDRFPIVEEGRLLGKERFESKLLDG